ncbi:putative alpha-glucosidase [Talaromyces proteolyticus]|uniref:Alpha-glucosidase n=1 Tax=Talaromyces proteolyticus TaxID=1131652 RepID=A0AAD4PUD9_9EURO|nr:putative alpha-glucosidase [Talaromyces proteolyticus]KAH8690012.1 putative alpha-glucosidase [Talaromyces proteolyticus]
MRTYLVIAVGLLLGADAAVLASRNGTASCPGYQASNVRTRNGAVVSADLTLAGPACNVYGTDLDNLKLEIEYETDKRVHVKIYDAAEQVYQVPTSVLPRPDSNNGHPVKSDFKVSIEKNPFSLKVTRRSTNEVLFDTSGHPLIFESQYLGLRTSLPDSPNLYGLGESTDSFRLQTDNYIRTLWSRDAYLTPQNSNLYGNHPVYFDHRGSKGTHAVFLLNSNGMDIKINKDSDGQYLEYNTLGGIFDFYFLAGPTPKDVAVQYSETIGKAVMMPYWGFGFHTCRYGYQDIYEVAEVIANYSAANIPLETQWTDIDYMDLRKVFTLDPLRYPLHLVREVVSYLHDHNQHYIVMVDPAVSYSDYPAFNDGVKDDAFLTTSNGSVYQGVVWPGIAAFPDWFAPKTQDYWNGQFSSFFSADTGVDIDALWIDMNEASNFCPWPCSDPAAFAQSNGDPPNPPAVRLSAPRPIPGFGPDFQPKCVASVSFTVHAETYNGENIYILGSSPSLGEGDSHNAVAMSAANYPEWQVTVDMPVNGTFTYEYIRRESDGSWIYEKQNRTITTGDCETGVQQVSGNITTNSGPQKRSLDSSLAPMTRSQTPRDIAQKRDGSMSGLPGRDLLDPAYHINNTAGSISNLTIRTDLHHSNGLALYDTHNFYGSMMSSASRDAMLGRRPSVRPMVITRSTFAGAGRQVGHWLGDNNADWDHYRWTIYELQEFAALYQIPMVGSDVCGFAGDTTDELCSRWIFVGAFSPFFRSHQNLGTVPHEFYRTPMIAAAARAAIDIRYRLLDYAYTAMWTQTQTGIPMINPIFFEYPHDDNTVDLPYQFFYGSSILVAPVTEENSTSVSIYLPKDLFYDFYTGAPVQGQGKTVQLTDVAFDTVPLYYKSGSIIPQRIASANTTVLLRQQNFEIVVAPDFHGRASGTLYLDDGDSIEQPHTSEIFFEYYNGIFLITGKFGYNAGDVAISQIRVLGENAKNHTVNVKLTGDYHGKLN